MRPDKLIARMLRDDRLMILFDRRRDVEQQAQSIGYELVDCATASSPVGNVTVYVALLRRALESAGNHAPNPDFLGRRAVRPSFVQLLDRFLVPAAGDPTVSSLFFQLIAQHYDMLTATETNRRTVEALLNAALQEANGEDSLKVLDFGCGTGCAIDALKYLGSSGQNVELLGTDLSEAMLSIAEGRGEKVVTLSEWRMLPQESFDAAISSFVLHYGVPEEELSCIAQQLKPGGIFSANLFKGDDIKLENLKRILRTVGLDLVSSEQSRITPNTYNLHLVFRKRERAWGS